MLFQLLSILSSYGHETSNVINVPKNLLHSEKITHWSKNKFHLYYLKFSLSPIYLDLRILQLLNERRENGPSEFELNTMTPITNHNTRGDLRVPTTRVQVLTCGAWGLNSQLTVDGEGWIYSHPTALPAWTLQKGCSNPGLVGMGSRNMQTSPWGAALSRAQPAVIQITGDGLSSAWLRTGEHQDALATHCKEPAGRTLSCNVLGGKGSM